MEQLSAVRHVSIFLLRDIVLTFNETLYRVNQSKNGVITQDNFRQKLDAGLRPTLKPFNCYVDTNNTTSQISEGRSNLVS